jgi:hypothetical protein
VSPSRPNAVAGGGDVEAGDVAALVVGDGDADEVVVVIELADIDLRVAVKAAGADVDMIDRANPLVRTGLVLLVDVIATGCEPTELDSFAGGEDGRRRVD